MEVADAVDSSSFVIAFHLSNFKTQRLNLLTCTYCTLLFFVGSRILTTNSFQIQASSRLAWSAADEWRRLAEVRSELERRGLVGTVWPGRPGLCCCAAVLLCCSHIELGDLGKFCRCRDQLVEHQAMEELQ